MQMFFMIKYAKVSDMGCISPVLHYFTFHDHFARFSHVHGLPHDVLRNRANYVPCIPRAAHAIKIRIVLFVHLQKQINRSKI